METRITVIMGIYNCEETLREALDSLLNQTYQGFKVIMCDDGSSDNTYKVAEEYAVKYPNKFLLIKNETNCGLNITLNKCLAIADTEYVARMDADDISLSERFEKEIEFLDKNKEYAFVSTPMIRFDETGPYSVSISKSKPEKMDFVKGTPFCHAPVLVRKEAYDDVSGYSVSESLKRVEDYHLWAKMYAKGLKGFNLDTPYYMMRDDKNAAKRRTFISRVNEYKVKLIIYRMLDLPYWVYPYALRPIIIGLLPKSAYNYLRRLIHR